MAVGQLMDRGTMLIVGETDAVRTHLADHRNVGCNVRIGFRPALAFEVLMQAHTLETIGLAVEEEAAFRIPLHLPHAEWLPKAVEQLAAAAAHLDDQGIEVWVDGTLPQANLRHGQGLLDALASSAPHLGGSRALAHRPPGCVHQTGNHRNRHGCSAIVTQIAAYGDGRIAILHSLGRGIDTGSAVIQHVEVHRVRRNQADRAVESAMDEEITL